ncbi:MAG: Spy/CpxP family protein refolding chaperone [Deltaproteobacteria bacterium]|nr:Spy/CpxP family protein refolding chaperone [Deltaproteobacteria bacterium]
MALFLAAIFYTGANLSIASSADPGSSTKVRRSPVERTEARIKDLETALKITPEQQGLWKALTQVMRDNAKTLEDLAKARADKSKEMNAVEDLKSYSQFAQAQVEGLKKYIPAFEALYNSMSNEQKKNADVLFKMGRHGKHKRK